MLGAEMMTYLSKRSPKYATAKRIIGPPKYVLPLMKSTKRAASSQRKSPPASKGNVTTIRSKKKDNKKRIEKATTATVVTGFTGMSLPSQRELRAVKHNRGKKALCTWYLRLEEYKRFKKEKGHGMYIFNYSSFFVF